ncbi:hypothetical protein ACFFRR_002518 [Megaselia abdita]
MSNKTGKNPLLSSLLLFVCKNEIKKYTFFLVFLCFFFLCLKFNHFEFCCFCFIFVEKLVETLRLRNILAKNTTRTKISIKIKSTPETEKIIFVHGPKMMTKSTSTLSVEVVKMVVVTVTSKKRMVVSAAVVAAAVALTEQ